MSRGSFVESPKGSPDGQSGQEYHAVLDELERQAGASVAEVRQVEGQIKSEQSRNEGAKAEGKRAAAGEEAEIKNANASPESQMAVAMVETAALPAALGIAKTGLEVLGERRSNPSETLSKKEAEGLGVTGKGTSFENAFKEIKSKPLGNLNSIPPRAEIASASLGKQQGTSIGSVASEQNSANLAVSCTHAMSLGIANERVLGQVMAAKQQNAHNLNHAPGMGSKSPTLECNKPENGPAYISPEQAARRLAALETDNAESWT